MFIGRIVQLGGSAHQPKRFFALSLSLRKPAGRSPELNLDLRGPIVITFDLEERLPDGGQFLNLMTRRGCIAAPGGPYRARKMDVGFGPAKTTPGKIARAQRQRGGLAPAPPFERIARRDGRERVSHFEVL